jgi:DNA-binding transcriptional ArsR family regulator
MVRPLDAPYQLDLSQVKAALHPLRTRIIEILAETAATPSEVGRRLGIAASKAHYHVGVLEKHGLVKLVESRTTNGITEHFYRAVASHFELRGARTSDGVAAMVEQELKALADDFRVAKEQGESATFLAIMRLSGTADNLPIVEERIEALRNQIDRTFAQPPGRAYRLVLGWAPLQEYNPEEESEC